MGTAQTVSYKECPTRAQARAAQSVTLRSRHDDERDRSSRKRRRATVAACSLCGSADLRRYCTDASATIGSTRVARRAGIRLATNPGGREQHRHAGEDDRIERADVVEQPGDRARDRERRDQAAHRPAGDEQHALPQHQAQRGRRRRRRAPCARRARASAASRCTTRRRRSRPRPAAAPTRRTRRAAAC